MYNTAYPAIDRVLQVLQNRFGPRSTNIDDSRSIAAIARRRLMEADKWLASRHRHDPANILTIVEMLKSMYAVGIKRVAFCGILLYGQNRRSKLRKYLKVKYNLWNAKRYPFNRSVCINCVQRLGKLRLSISYHRWMQKRSVFTRWLEFIIARHGLDS